MLIDKNGMYRPSKIKDESKTCYAQESFSWASTTKNSNLRAAIDRTVGKSLPEKFYMKDENVSTCMKAKNVLLKTLQLVASANGDSEKTLKVESSENNHNSVDDQHWSGSTVKVNSDGDYEEDEGTTLLRRTKRAKQISQQSERSFESEKRRHEQDAFQGKSEEGLDVIGSSKLEDAYNQGVKGNEEIQDHKNEGAIKTEEVMEHTSKDDTEALKAHQEVSIGDGVGSETKVTAQQKVVQVTIKKNVEGDIQVDGNLEAKVKETRAASTTSFEYLLQAENTTLYPQIQSKEAGKGNAPSFSGFTSQKTCIDEHLSQQHKASCSKIDFDINVTLIAGEDDRRDDEKDKHVVDNHMGNEDGSWADYLDKEREKYFFYDDDTPTLHLLENWDDCGNEITEPELWRPLHMKAEEYNRKIENAKKSIAQQNIEEGETSKYHQEQEIKSSEVYVHCAQQQQSPLTAITPDGGIIDLTSPNTNIQNEWNQAHTCYYPRNKNTTYKTTSTTPPSNKKQQ